MWEYKLLTAEYRIYLLFIINEWYRGVADEVEISLSVLE